MVSQQRKKKRSGCLSRNYKKKCLKLGWTLCFVLFLAFIALYEEIHLSIGRFLVTNISKSWASRTRLKSSKKFMFNFVPESKDFQASYEDSTDNSSIKIYDSAEGRSPANFTFASNSNFFSAQKFIVDTPTCKIPNHHPFHKSIKLFLAKPVPINCSTAFDEVTTSRRNILYFHPEKLPSLYHKQFMNNSNFPSFNAIVHSSYTKVSFLNRTTGTGTETTPSPVPDVKCCYRYIERVTQKRKNASQTCDGKWKYSRLCYPVKKEKMRISYNSIVVMCNSTDIIYSNVHHFIKREASLRLIEKTSNKYSSISNSEVAKPSVNYETHSQNRSGKGLLTVIDPSLKAQKTRTTSDNLSVIIFGTDSVSRLNFLRKLPKTYSYLTDNLEALEFKGFNKVGDNTFPNLVPILSGMSSAELKNHTCLPSSGPKVFDDCPWIWKHFKRKRFVTAFMEDSPWMGIFNYVHPGFLNPPTDYYGRPYFLASEKLIGKLHKGNSNICQGNRLSLEVVHRYSLDLLDTFPDHPIFGLFWSASVTHDFINFASLTDEPHLKYLQSLEKIGALNRTVLIFMSDHGMRWGKFRKTHIGTLEERLPFLFIVFPKWFKHKYPLPFSNLKKNTNSLIANYDLHATLMDLVNDRYSDLEYIEEIKRSKGISLFKEIPTTRTCEDAGIPQHFCTCQEMKPVNKTDSLVQEAATYVKDFINKGLKAYVQCLQVEKMSVENSLALVWNEEGVTPPTAYEKKFYRTLFLQLKLEPGNALVEATVKAKEKNTERSFEILGEISRINSYGRQSHCIKHDILRKFCICTDSI